MVASKKVAGWSWEKRINLRFDSSENDEPVKPISEPLSEEEQQLLIKLAGSIPMGQACVCVGSEEALTWLMRGIKEEQGVKLYFINLPENDDVTDPDDGEIGTVPFTALNPEELEKIDIFSFKASTEASRKCREKVGLLWINSICSYEDLKKVLLAWQPKLAANAKVAFHSCHWPAPAKLIKEYLGDQGDFLPSDSVSHTSVMSLDQCTHYWMIDSRDIGACKYCGRKRNFKRIRNGAQRIHIPRKKA